MRTPASVYDPVAHEVRTLWIAGDCGRELLRVRGAGPAGTHDASISDALIAKLVAPLVALHAAAPAGLELAPYDPWCRIRPRLCALHNAPPNAGAAIATATCIAEALETTARRLVLHVPGRASTSQVVVHGDYHVGQLVVPRDMSDESAVWLLDLDDLALGRAETDLGNFVAHLASLSAPSPVANATGKFTDLMPRICWAYEARAGQAVSRELVTLYGAFALLRRALKFHEAQAPRSTVETILSASAAIAAAIAAGMATGS